MSLYHNQSIAFLPIFKTRYYHEIKKIINASNLYARLKLIKLIDTFLVKVRNKLVEKTFLQTSIVIFVFVLNKKYLI